MHSCKSEEKHQELALPLKGGSYADTFIHTPMAFAHSRYYKEDTTAQSALSFLQKQNKKQYFV